MAKTLIGAIEELARTSGFSPLMNDIVEQLAVYQNAVSHPIGEESREELELCYTVGTLQFTSFKEEKQKVRYGLLDMDLFNLDGRWNGRYLTIWKPEIFDASLMKVPAPEYTGPWNEVVKPIPHFPMRANSNAAYTFEGNGGTPKGTLYATGPANLLLTPVKGGGFVFQVSVAAYVTGGTGDFSGARGTNTALGSSFIPENVDISNVPDGQPIGGVTVSTFRIVRKENQSI